MADYIDREALRQDISDTVRFTVKSGEPSAEMRGANKIIERIRNAPAAEVVTWEQLRRVWQIATEDAVPWEWLERYAHGRGMQYASGFVDEAKKAWEADNG